MSQSRKVIFVGMHNKPGYRPLSSQTKSGALIDKVIQALNDVRPELKTLKTNLYDLDHWPLIPSFPYDWAERADYWPDDIIVVLGDATQKRFKRSTYKFISAGHPSGVWSNNLKEEYVKKTVDKILNFKS